MPYSVHFAEDIEVPPELRARVFKILVEISETLETIPASSAFWSAVNTGNAEVNLGGWKFEYSIRRGDRRILVTEAWQRSGDRVG
jgi:hypothetical protein